MSASALKHPARAFHDGVCAQCGLPLKLLPGRELCGACADRALLLWASAAIEAAQQQSAPVWPSDDAQPTLRYVDGLRVAYTLPDGRDVRVSPAPGAVRIVRWLTRAETSSGEEA